MTLRLFLRVMLLASLTGCYSHVYHVRKTSHDHNEVAIDRINPHTSVKWGTWWAPGEPTGPDGPTGPAEDAPPTPTARRAQTFSNEVAHARAAH